MAQIDLDILNAAWADDLIKPNLTDRQCAYLPRSVVTASRLLRILQQSTQGLNTDQCAKQMEIHPNTIKIYARYLADKGLVDIESLPQRGCNLYKFCSEKLLMPGNLIRTQIPESSWFEAIDGTTTWPYQWQAKQSYYLRICAKERNPWHGKGERIIRLREQHGKGKHAAGTSRLDLLINDKPLDPRLRFELVLDSIVGMAHTIEPTYRFYAFRRTDGEGSGYLALSVVSIPT